MVSILGKKEFTSFDIAAVVRELNSAIIHARVSNIYQIDPWTFLFKLHKPNMQQLNLIVESSRRLHLTSYNVEKPETPPAFCMALRSRLRNALLETVEQHEFERVVTFTFRTGEGEERVVLELFGEGNIIIISENNEILQALTYKRMRDRNILRGEAFSFAPSIARNPICVSKKELKSTLLDMGEAETVRALTRTVGIGGLYAEEILLRSGIEKTKHCNALDEKELDAIYAELQGLLKQVKQSALEPCIVLDKSDKFTDVLPLKLKVYAAQEMKFQLYFTFNEALDEFYARATAIQKATSGIEVDELRREADRLKRIIKEQEDVVDEAEKQIEKDKQAGDAIYGHTPEVQSLLDRLSTARKTGKEHSQIVQEILTEKKLGREPSKFLESFDAKGMLAKVQIGDSKFVLDLRKNLYENASAYYEQSKRSKQKVVGAKAALEESLRKLADVESKIVNAEMLEKAEPEIMEALAASKITRKEWFEKFRWFMSSDGFLVVAGKDAVSNEVLIKRHAKPNDIVFHSDITGAPFVLVKAENKQPTEQVMHQAAEFAAAYSRGWREGFASIDVYWIKPEQLTKTPPSVEYVPHGAFIVTGKRNWMRNISLTTAIGITVMEDGDIEFVGGPTEAVKSKTKALVILAPGDNKGKELFKHIIGVLAQQFPKEKRDKVFRASIEKVREFVPYSSGRLIN